jgi:hypothetical protein
MLVKLGSPSSSRKDRSTKARHDIVSNPVMACEPKIEQETFHELQETVVEMQETVHECLQEPHEEIVRVPVVTNLPGIVPEKVQGPEEAHLPERPGEAHLLERPEEAHLPEIGRQLKTFPIQDPRFLFYGVVLSIFAIAVLVKILIILIY